MPFPVNTSNHPTQAGMADKAQGLQGDKAEAEKAKRKSKQKRIEHYLKNTKAVLPGNFKEAVKLPQNLELNEWLAVHSNEHPLMFL